MRIYPKNVSQYNIQSIKSKRPARAGALNSNIEGLWLSIFLPNVGVFFLTLRLPTNIKTGRHEIAPKWSLKVGLKHNQSINHISHILLFTFHVFDLLHHLYFFGDTASGILCMQSIIKTNNHGKRDNIFF